MATVAILACNGDHNLGSWRAPKLPRGPLQRCMAYGGREGRAPLFSQSFFPNSGLPAAVHLSSIVLVHSQVALCSTNQNGSSSKKEKSLSLAAKPIKSLELHYKIIQLLIITITLPLVP